MKIKNFMPPQMGAPEVFLVETQSGQHSGQQMPFSDASSVTDRCDSRFNTAVSRGLVCPGPGWEREGKGRRVYPQSPTSTDRYPKRAERYASVLLARTLVRLQPPQDYSADSGASVASPTVSPIFTGPRRSRDPARSAEFVRHSNRLDMRELIIQQYVLYDA